MFAPARLWTSEMPDRSSTDAAIAAVVVLPLVAEHEHRPARQPAGELGDRVRLEAHQHLAGQARAAAASGAPRKLADRARGDDLGSQRRHRESIGPLGTITRTAPGSARTVTGSSAIGSPSAYIVNGRSALISTSRPRRTSTFGWRTCSPLNTVGSSRRKRTLGHVADDDHVEQAVLAAKRPGAMNIPPPYALEFAAATV